MTTNIANLTPAKPTRFAIVPLWDGQPAPTLAIMSGSLDAVLERITDSRARSDAIALISRADAALASLGETAALHEQLLREGITALTARMDAIAARLDAAQRTLTADAKADAEAEQARIQHMLDELPDPDDPDGLPATSAPTGDLHVIAASEPGNGDEGDLPDPDNPTLDGVPLSYGNVPTSYVHSAKKDIGEGKEFSLPQPSGSALGPHGKSGKVVPQPTAISIG
jgi:hypothetical protein